VAGVFDELAEQQCDVVSRAQLNALGINRHLVRSNVEGGRWQLSGGMVVVLHSGPLTRRQREWAAVLGAGRDAALAGRTALAVAGLRGWDDEAVHILTPRGRTPPPSPGLRVISHQTRSPADGQLDVVGLLPRTRVERSAIDAAIWSPRPRTACGLVAAVVQQRLTTAPRLIQVLAQTGRVRHRVVLRLALTDIAGGAQALTEIDFAKLCRDFDLGIVRHQAVRLDGQGKRRYLDAEIESPSGVLVWCEVDGAIHLQPTSYWDDMSRSNELVIAGVEQLHFPSIAFHLDRARVADQIRRAQLAKEQRPRAA
jgi:hypothetical protein